MPQWPCKRWIAIVCSCAAWGDQLAYFDSEEDYEQQQASIRAANSRGPGGSTGPLRTPSRTPWTLSR